jgi:2-polyprenyl-3-methyl-5-hydroxy-6-metoxy-1,4-benzoquinol methylase
MQNLSELSQASHQPRDWGGMAEFWNAIQGERGDVYRQAVIMPALEEVIGDPSGQRILDMGCGNGCVARHLASLGAHVVGVDSSLEMLQTAQRYSTSGISYLQIDLDTCQGRISEGEFDAIIACFTLQDCTSIDNALRLAHNNVSDAGFVILVLENDYVFGDEYTHRRTTRTWLDSVKQSGVGRRQLITWDARFFQPVPDALPPLDTEQFRQRFSRPVSTITHHWSAINVLRTAEAIGLQVIKGPYDLDRVRATRVTRELSQYLEMPSFQLLAFSRMVWQKL